jgi:hypothetical protein
MESILVVGRGSAGLIEPANERIIPNRTGVAYNTTVSTAPPSQATLFFFDGGLSDRLIANVTLKDHSSIALRSAFMPRFEWSTAEYGINLGDAVGEFDITISDDIDRPVVMSIQGSSQRDIRVHLRGSGHYILNFSETRMRVFNRDGEAYLIPGDGQGYSVPAGKQGVIRMDERTVELLPGYIDLLVNSDFSEASDGDRGGTAQKTLNGWVCSGGPNDDPPGAYRHLVEDGRATLHLTRYQEATTHGWTFCSQTFGSSALNVNELNLQYLGLRATFYINHQSLDTCGFAGSECPLMLRMDYINQRGEAHKWYHGFFGRRDPQSSNPLICSGGCWQEHELINPNAWYTYDSGNLLALFPEEEQINSVIGVWFYASGHEYDVQVSEVALVGQQSVDGYSQSSDLGG